MKTLLVSGASGIIGYGILRSLRKSGGNFRLIGTSIHGESAAEGFCDIFELAPRTSEPHYIDWLTHVVSKHQIDLIIPGIEADVHSWSENFARIRELSEVGVMLNSPQLISLCRDKWEFYEVFRKSGHSAVIETCLEKDFELLSKRFGLPFLLKPREGHASRGIVIIDSLPAFSAHRDQIGPILMVQPLVGNEDEEFTTSAFGDGQGSFYAHMTLKRKLSKTGFTESAEVVEIPEMEETLKDLCALFRPLGPTNFQFRKDHGVLKLLEVNPRISSSTSLRTAFGYNECRMAVDFFLGKISPSQPTIRRGRAMRYTEDLIVYL